MSVPGAGLGALEHRQYELLPGKRRPEDDSLVSIFARRPVFEYPLQKAVEAEANVTIQAKTRVVGLLADGVRSDGRMRVSGVRVQDAEDIPRWLGGGRARPHVAAWVVAEGIGGPAGSRAAKRLRPPLLQPSLPVP